MYINDGVFPGRSRRRVLSNLTFVEDIRSTFSVHKMMAFVPALLAVALKVTELRAHEAFLM